jgi:hypothetical protein
VWTSSSSVGVSTGGPPGLLGKVGSLYCLGPSAGVVAGAGGMPPSVLRVWIAGTSSESSMTIEGIPGLLLLYALEGVKNRGENR